MQRSVLCVMLVGAVALAILTSDGWASDKSAKGFPGQVARGKYLVDFGGCHDCHSPKVMTPMGPVADTTRPLSGHPANEKLAEVPFEYIAPDKWAAVTNNHFTAWAGPWGISFARNLTPDVTTGLGSWTEEMFIKTMRTGKQMGEGRPILPPMPWPQVGSLTDDDLKAVFAYLQSVKPIENAVPDPIPPPAGK
ncbi:MAG: c-type cytochrome [Bacteroidota bacterium]